MCGERAGWIDLLGYHGKVRMELANTAPKIFPLTIPKLGASESELVSAESRLGEPLDRHLRELLGFADGWPSIFLDVDLLGTADLGDGPAWESAHSTLDDIYDDGLPPDLPPKNELFGHPVIWLHNEVVERYSNVRMWLTEVARLTKLRLETYQREGVPHGLE
jgi:hypothetical protein